ncbi:MAG: S8 family serine peptidase [Bacteroidota bacterium]
MKSALRTTLSIMLVLFSVTIISAQPKIDNNILNGILSGETQLEVVITFNGNTAPSTLQLASLNQLGIVNAFSFKSLPMVGAVVTPAQIDALSNNTQIKSIYLNKKLDYYNYDATALTGVDRLRKDQTLTSKNGGFPVSGKGVTVLINDSGVDGTHEDIKFGNHLIQNAMGSTNPHAYSSLLPIVYLENIPNTDNNSGHGTHVAGSVGGNGSRSAGKYEGVAPGANLIGYGSGAALFVLDGIGGFDYAVTYQFLYNIRVITNSWGSSGSFDPYDPVNIASKIAYDRGIVVLFAAGNDGPGENTHTPYAAPWVISVAAGDKYGRLADFSSCGVEGQTSTFQIDGETWTYENRPTITAPGVDVVSTRVIAPVSSLAADADATTLEPAYVPFYTIMSGTSMATPHTAGVVALMLEADKTLSPAQVKEILQKTATNMPNYESWENGAGYVNAYAAVDYIMNNRSYNSLANMYQQFNSSVNNAVVYEDFTIDYRTQPLLSPTQNRYSFNVNSGTSAIEVSIDELYGLLGQTGNPINLILISPDGGEYSSGIPVLFAIDYKRTVSVANPITGTWIVELRGLRGDAANPTSGVSFDEIINGKVKFVTFLGHTGLNDISGHPAEASIKLAVSSRLVDGFSNGLYKPDNKLKRIDMAKYLMMGQAIRQYLPTDGSLTITDVDEDNQLLVESITAKGAAIRDRFQVLKGVMQPTSNGFFSPEGSVARIDLAYSFIQSLGLQLKADELAGTEVKVVFNDQVITLDDNNDIPAELRGYVQLALDLNLINAYFSLTQGQYDLEPTMHAKFKPNRVVSRGDFAVIVTRTFNEWTKALAKMGSEQNTITLVPTEFKLEQNYPNPFNPSTVISFSLAKDGMISLEVFNLLGEKVATLVNDYRPAGKYTVNFDASKLASGIYLYRISSAEYVKTLKMNFIK